MAILEPIRRIGKYSEVHAGQPVELRFVPRAPHFLVRQLDQLLHMLQVATLEKIVLEHGGQRR